MQPASLSQLVSFFFSMSGRASRQEYFLGMAFLFTLNAALINLVIGQAAAGSAGVDPASLSAAVLISLPFLPSPFFIGIRRCHDIGLPGLFVLLFLVPFIQLAWMIALALIPGNGGPNAFGDPPRYRPG